MFGFIDTMLFWAFHLLHPFSFPLYFVLGYFSILLFPVSLEVIHSVSIIVCLPANLQQAYFHWGWLSNDPKDLQSPVPGTRGCDFIRRKGSEDVVKEAEMEREFWIMQVGLMSSAPVGDLTKEG